ncbi:hypothetical protein EYR40_004111 [Pleurotus pulmonarius]|nr:hypothetical protein EYR40_004111 [Pleurotus pulmonarius]KAF4606815.1 hypothetical protein EYR38_000870 [Pleurotus pulmonarius]
MPHLRLRDRIGDVVVVEGTPQRSGTITWIFMEDGETRSHIRLKDNGRIIGAVLQGGRANGSWYEWNSSNTVALPASHPAAAVELDHECLPNGKQKSEDTQNGSRIQLLKEI